MKVLAYYSYVLAGLSVLSHLIERNNPVSETSPWLAAAWAGAFLVVGKLLTIFANRRKQRQRDKRAADVFTRLARESIDDEAAPYALYLRPFSTTGRLLVTNPRRPWLPIFPSYFAYEKTLEFETMLSEALDPKLSLIALGRPGEHIGAGRVAVADEDWRNVFQLLVRGAKWILMIPSEEGETRWEVQQLITQGYLTKTVFLMPPMRRSHELDVPDYWERARTGLQELALQLPKYVQAGQLFRLGDTGRFYRSRYLPELKAPLLRDRFLGLTAGSQWVRSNRGATPNSRHD